MFETTAIYHRLTPQFEWRCKPKTSESSNAPAARCARLNSSRSSQHRQSHNSDLRQGTATE